MNQIRVALLVLLVFVLQGSAISQRLRPVAPSAANDQRATTLRGLAAFNLKYGGKWQIVWNAVTGAPRRLQGGRIALSVPLSHERIEPVTRTFLSTTREVLQIDVTQLVLTAARFQPPVASNRGSGTWFVTYSQQHRGVPVYGGSIGLTIRSGAVTVVGGDFFPNVDVSVAPKLSAQRAAAIVTDIFKQGGPGTLGTPRLMIFPEATGSKFRYRLVWQVTAIVESSSPDPVSLETTKQSILFVDAATGGLVHRHDPLQRSSGFIPQSPSRAPIKSPAGSLTYSANAAAQAATLSGRVTGLVRRDSPSDPPVEMPMANLYVDIVQGGNTTQLITNNDGRYFFTGIPGLATIHSVFAGPHLVVHNSETPDPDSTHQGQAILQAGTATTHDWEWSLDDQSPNDEETNAFYQIDQLRNWFLRGGSFNVSPIPDPMQVNVRRNNSGSWANSAGLFIQNTGGLWRDLLAHEYTHRIHEALVADAPPADSEEYDAMEEAWADYFACAYTDDPNHMGVRNLESDLKYDTRSSNIYTAGLVLSGALWDLRTRLGGALVDGLALSTIARTPHADSFGEYLLALLEQDDDPTFSSAPSANNDLSDGTPNIDSICDVFYEFHGIFHEACIGHTRVPISRIEAPDMRFSNVLSPDALSVSIIGSATGSRTEPLVSFLLEYQRIEQSDGPWVQGIWPTLDDNDEIQPISRGVLGNWYLQYQGLQSGFYNIRLTVVTATTTARAQTQVYFDKRAKRGWPAIETTTTFTGAPLVADLDPTYTGLEVVSFAAMRNGTTSLYGWHADGTSMTGNWPVPNLNWSGSAAYFSSPACGDLDRDGDLEIVVLTRAGMLEVIRADGTFVAGSHFHVPLITTTVVDSDSTPALVDLNLDGTLEIVAGVGDRIFGIGHDGALLAGWPQAVTGQVVGSPAVADIDGDGQPEVVAASTAGMIYVWRSNGISLTNWPKTTPGAAAVASGPVLGDLNGDGNLEVMFSAADGKFHAWQFDGSAANGWPRGNYFITRVPTSASVADLDNDGNIEVLAIADNHQKLVWNRDGTPHPGWPTLVNSGLSPSWTPHFSPTIVDLDNDGSREVVASHTSNSVIPAFGQAKLGAFRFDGTQQPDWPRALPGKVDYSAPMIADIDGDQIPELLVGAEGGFLVWNLPNAADSDWPQYRHDAQRTGAYVPDASVVLLLDVSASMKLAQSGNAKPVGGADRLSLAKRAGTAFLDVISRFGLGRVNVAVVSFPGPRTPGTPPGTFLSAECNWGYFQTPSGLIPALLLPSPPNDVSINSPSKLAHGNILSELSTTTLPGLSAAGATSLLDGLDAAIRLLRGQKQKAILLISDGHKECSSFWGPNDQYLTAAVTRLKDASVRVYTVGLGMPTDIDHFLLSYLANSTRPPLAPDQFHEVTGRSFQSTTWNPQADLEMFYRSILSGGLGIRAAEGP
jgi:hypothetical protein